jgi:hypothetical protein
MISNYVVSWAINPSNSLIYSHQQYVYVIWYIYIYMCMYVCIYWLIYWFIYYLLTITILMTLILISSDAYRRRPAPGSSLIGLHAMDTLEAPLVPLLVGSPQFWNPSDLGKVGIQRSGFDGDRMENGDLIWFNIIWYYMIFCFDILWYYMILYNIIWYYTILYDIIWSYMILYDIIWHYMILYDIIWYYMILYDSIWYYMILYGKWNNMVSSVYSLSDYG